MSYILKMISDIAHPSEWWVQMNGESLIPRRGCVNPDCNSCLAVDIFENEADCPEPTRRLSFDTIFAMSAHSKVSGIFARQNNMFSRFDIPVILLWLCSPPGFQMSKLAVSCADIN